MWPLKSRRKVSGIVVDPRALIRFSIPFFILMIANFVIIQWNFRHIFSQISDATATGQNDTISLIVLSQIIISAMTFGNLAVVILSFVTLGIWVIYSHRIFGPSVPMRRHIEELCAGNYQNRIKLRKNDEFKEIAEALNQLSDILQKKERSK